jgi:hypothetical protein
MPCAVTPQNAARTPSHGLPTHPWAPPAAAAAEIRPFSCSVLVDRLSRNFATPRPLPPPLMPDRSSCQPPPPPPPRSAAAPDAGELPEGAAAADNPDADDALDACRAARKASRCAASARSAAAARAASAAETAAPTEARVAPGGCLCQLVDERLTPGRMIS